MPLLKSLLLVLAVLGPVGRGLAAPITIDVLSDAGDGLLFQDDSPFSQGTTSNSTLTRVGIRSAPGNPQKVNAI